MEIDQNYSELATTIKIDQVLHRSLSKYQDILIFHKYIDLLNFYLILTRTSYV